MFTIRKGLFETNSSSTHAIVVSLEKDHKITRRDLLTGWSSYNFEFGREVYRLLDTWDYKLAYIYIILLDIANNSDVVSPLVDIEKFKSNVNNLYLELFKQQEDNRYYSDRVTPDQIFQVLDFLQDVASGKISADYTPEFNFDTGVFEDVLENEYCFIDHTEYFIVTKEDDRRFSPPCAEVIRKLQNDIEYLKSFLFSDESYITIGGDEYQGYNLKTIGFEYDYKRRDDWIDRVNEYRKTHDVYFKGN